jgi:hypothetical protein
MTENDVISVVVHYKLIRGNGEKENYFYIHFINKSDLKQAGYLMSFSEEIKKEMEFLTFSELGLSTEVKKAKIKSFQVLNF